MQKVQYLSYAKEAFKITVFCVAVILAFFFTGSSNTSLLVAFYTAAMSCSATFSIQFKHLHHITTGSFVVGLSIIGGGISGYYLTDYSKLLVIIYAGLAFYLPKTRQISSIFVTGSITFLVFTMVPFDLTEGMQYLINCLMVIAGFICFYLLFEFQFDKKKENTLSSARLKNNHITACIAVSSLMIAWLISYLLSIHYYLPKIYWIELTTLVVIAGSSQDTIKTSFKRMIACILAAVIMVFIFNYLEPEFFWLQLSILLFFLFFIFFFNFMYIAKVLFIELFVLFITFLLGNQTDIIAVKRIVLTTIGGLIVIAMTLVFRKIFKIKDI
ncbi:MAG: hypothetical protein EBZ47_01965 [Chlamydiae bacterium]|nr:hypothetical protein [Chlamydiota bacterium]